MGDERRSTGPDDCDSGAINNDECLSHPKAVGIRWRDPISKERQEAGKEIYQPSCTGK
jgi:hypothetical protein